MRLIDADELKKALAEMWYERNIRITVLSVAELIDEAPTIEPSGDFISRHDALMELNGACSIWQDDSKVAEIIKALPSADTKRVLQGYCKGANCKWWNPQVNGCNRCVMIQDEYRHTSADKVKGYNLETIADIVRQLGHLDSYITDTCDRPKGDWINREDSADVFFLYKYECSVCGGKAVLNSTYCPNCGAEMNGE